MNLPAAVRFCQASVVTWMKNKFQSCLAFPILQLSRGADSIATSLAMSLGNFLSVYLGVHQKNQRREGRKEVGVLRNRTAQSKMAVVASLIKLPLKYKAHDLYIGSSCWQQIDNFHPFLAGFFFSFPKRIRRNSNNNNKKVFWKAIGRICASFLQSAPSTAAIIKIPLLIPCWCQQVHSDVSCQTLAGDVIAACYVTKAMGSRKNIKSLHRWKSKLTPILIASRINVLTLRRGGGK